MTTGLVPQDTVPRPPASQPERPWRPGYGPLRAVGAGITALLVGAGVVSGIPEMVQRDATESLGWPADTKRLEITAPVGSVNVIEDAALDAGITVGKQWAFVEPAVRLTSEDGVTRVVLDCSRSIVTARCAGDWDVVVPEGLPVTVTSNAGHVALTGVTGDVVVSNTVGETQLIGSPRTLEATSQVGSIVATLSAPADRVVLRNTVGEVDLTLPPGHTWAVTARSDVDDVVTGVPVSSSSPYVVDVRTELGSVRIDDE